MIRLESDCVGCPQGCINCGRQDGYLVLECDVCKDTVDTLYYSDEDKEVCLSCLTSHKPQKDGVCEICGKIATLYPWMDEWMCEDCIRDGAEKVEVEDE